MIPPGLHFIYFSAVSRQGDTAPRTGFFHFFKRRELLVRHYNATEEDLESEDTNTEEMERIHTNLRDLDRFLGPYPMESWQKWVSLTQHVSLEDLQRLMPLSGKICSVPELIRLIDTSSSTSTDVLDSGGGTDDVKLCQNSENKESEKAKNEVDVKTEDEPSKPSLPKMIPRPGTEIRFCKFPCRPYREGATPSEITHYSLDSSYSVKIIIDTLGRAEALLAELQFAFACFLVGQVWDGWEHWQRLLIALCSAEELLLEKHDIYLKLLSLIHFQVQEVPEDLFVDIVESNNFLATALKVLFANISDNSAELPSTLVTKAQRFKHHLSTKFGWNLTMEDDGEDAPVIVETDVISASDST